MPEKRKDSKGRVLKDGESQRANGTYDYRYTDIHKKRRCIYAKSLTELRKKEEELWRDLADGIDYAAGEMTVADLVDRYMNLKRGLKPNSLRSYNTAVKRIHADPFGQKAIKTVKLSDAKGWFVFLHDSGFKQNTIGILQSVVRPAFEMAVEDDIIRKNPLPRDAPKVNIEERTIWDEKTMLAALQTIENPALHLAVHMSMILSLREGEILGLQPSDLDFDAADGRGTISVNKTMQRANKDALEKLDPKQVYYTFPDRREGSKSSLILKKPKTKKSNRVLYMTKPLKEELLAWLEKLKQDEQNAPEKYSNCGQLFRLPDGLPIAPELLTKWYRQWRSAHPEFEQIVFHGLRHSSATYQLLQSDGDFKSVQGNTGHATASVLMDTYAHTQDKPRLELTEKIEANFYSQDLTPAAPQPRQNEKPAATKISGKEILEAIRLMDADERRELTRALFA